MRVGLLAPGVGMILLSACASPQVCEPVVQIKTVSIPVPVRCKPDLTPPLFADTDAALRAAPNTYEWAKRLVAGRLQRMAWEAEQDAAIKACAGG